METSTTTETTEVVTPITPRRCSPKRFYYAFKLNAVIDLIQEKTKQIVLIAWPGENDDDLSLTAIKGGDKSRVVNIGNIYDPKTTEAIIHAGQKPEGASWKEWLDKTGVYVGWFDELAQCDDSLNIVVLVLMDHPNRTKNVRRILNEGNMHVVSSTTHEIAAMQINGAGVTSEKKTQRLPDANFIYGRPPLPDFNKLSDEEHARYLKDNVTGLDDLIPVYDFAVKTLSFNQVLDNTVPPREALVLVNGKPLLSSESITEIFAWRGTGKTLFSLALALHLAAGKSMPGFEISSSRKVLYVEGELPASELKERIQQLSQGLGDIRGFYLTAKSGQELGRDHAVTINTEAGRLAIEAELEETGATVLFLDSIASIAQIDTNNEALWFPIITWMVDLRCRGICVVYLQQAGKKGEQRGHSVSEDRIDRAIKLTATSKTAFNGNKAAFKMSFTKERQGSISPICLTCTDGVWALDEQTKKAKEEQIESGKREEIIAALKGGESQRSIAKRFTVSPNTISKINKEMIANDIPNTSAHD
jgi:hypothetical protein